jgi:hypothetical protein
MTELVVSRTEEPMPDTHTITRDSPGQGGRGLGPRCHCGRNATMQERIMGKPSGRLCTPCADEARDIWEQHRGSTPSRIAA